MRDFTIAVLCVKIDLIFRNLHNEKAVNSGEFERHGVSMTFQRDIFKNRSGIRYYDIDFGGSSKDELLLKLERASILLNDYCRQLFASCLFVTSAEVGRASIIELAVEDLGFQNGANFVEINERMKQLNLFECPLEIGPYFRLQYTGQIEFTETGKHKAPAGSVTVISRPPVDDDDFPKGFYLRKIDGKLWLRGYLCPMDHVWEPGARLAFRIFEK